VSAGDPRHGRRDNGLTASEYAAAGDVDPRVGEHLLDVLALDGIAAYLRPTTDLNPVTRSSSLPGRPTDRLYVDRSHLATAREYMKQLAEEAPPPADPDVDEAWAQIVAGFDADTPSPRRPWPAAEDVSEERPHRLPTHRPRTTPRPTADEDEPSLLDGLDTFGADLPDEEDERFVPPTPPPLPRPSLPAVLGVIGIIGGIAVFLRPDLLPIGAGSAMVLGFAACLAGAVTLVWRLRSGDDDDPDDGARV